MIELAQFRGRSQRQRQPFRVAGSERPATPQIAKSSGASLDALPQPPSLSLANGIRTRWAFTVAFFLILLSPINLSAQDLSPEAGSQSAESSSQESESDPTPSRPRSTTDRDAEERTGQLQYVGPDTYILLDAEGRPQPMPGMTYEDFMAAWRQAQKLEDRSDEPRYAIEAASIEGRSLDRHAEMKIEFSIRLLANERLAVPLGLAGAILDGQPQFKRTDNNSSVSERRSRSTERDESPYLHYDPQQGGFVAWFAAKAGDEYTVAMNVLVPLAQNGAARTLQLNCPRALTSKMSLQLDANVTDVSTTDGAVLTRRDLPNGGTRFDVSGVAGPFRLTWNNVQSNVDEPATVLSATGKIDVSIDGRSTHTRARLSVQSYGGEFDRFRVRLPPGAKLVQQDQTEVGAARKEADIRIRVEPESISAISRTGATQDRQVVIVELTEKRQGPVEVTLSTEQPLAVSGEYLTAELGGFEVVGAVRQFGDIALRIADDWQSRWENGNNVRQVDPTELAMLLQQPGLTAAFQYDRQPWSLPVRLTAQSVRIHVTPEYQLECLPDEARLRVRLAYQVLGARAFEFHVALQRWELTADPIESGGLVDRDRVVVTREDTLVLPLLEASSRRAEISFNLRRTTPRDDDRLSLPLPIPKAELVGSGTLIVDAAPGVELVPDVARSPGLAAMPVDSSLEDDGITPMDGFRFRTLIPEVVFTADRISRPREVTSEVVTRATFSDSDVEIVQHVDYSVNFEPVHELVFDIPEELSEVGALIEVALVAAGAGDQPRQPAETPLTIQPVLAESTPVGADGFERIRATLPQPRMGRFAAVIRYTIPWSQSKNDSGRLLLPLVQPAEGRVMAQRAAVRAPRDLSIGLQNDASASSWQSQSAADASRTGTLEFVTTRRERTLPLSVQSVDVNASSTTTIERVWLQAWVADDVRQDRAAFQFRTAGPAVTVELPPDTVPDEVEARLDGRPARVVTREPGRLVVWLTDSSPNDAAIDREADEVHTLELRYRRPTADGLIVRRLFSPPQLVGLADWSEVYWHIVLPGDTYVVRSPRNLASASAWQWLGSFWGRHPTMSQQELEDWVSASPQLAPTTAQNQYLFTGLAPLKSIEVVTAPRWLIVILASSALLAAGLLWIYVPLVRRGWIMLAMACVLASLALAFPTPAVLLGQAALLGVVLSMVAGMIARLTARPRVWTQPPRTSGSSLRHVTPRAESALLTPLSVAASSVPTAPLHAADSQS